MAARVSWYGAQGKEEGGLMLVEQDFLSLVPPTSLMRPTAPVSSGPGTTADSTTTPAVRGNQGAGGSAVGQPEKAGAPGTISTPGPASGSLEGGR